VTPSNRIKSNHEAGAAAARPVQNGSATRNERQVSILLVDDRDDKRLAMQTILADLGQNVVGVPSGAEALRCLLQREFAVILLDVNMPVMDGFETAFLIRQRASSEHTPIIFITGISDGETHVSRGYSLGAVDYITTPVLPEVLRAKVSVFVELFRKTELEQRVADRTKELSLANTALQQEIAERQRAEERILKINGELERRVQDRTAELLAANQELEAFTYSVAHDLQAPLRNIQSYSELLGDDVSHDLSTQGQQYLKRIASRAGFMRQLVEDLLELSRLGKQTLNRETADLGALLHEIVSGLKADTEARRIEWRLDKLPFASCDANLVRQVFANLLSNAVKYTQPRESAVITVACIPNPAEICVCVKDNGVGFDMQHANKLFGAFQRLHRPGLFDGTGVGLAIVARIIRKHGGRVWAEAEEDKGATFFFTLGPGSTSVEETCAVA
jgi:signal transduction histidine kinase